MVGTHNGALGLAVLRHVLQEIGNALVLALIRGRQTGEDAVEDQL